MAAKILKSHTIVPDSLYVRREADRILAEVITDMGRPGYILVARQMGKTNLLLHAKRTLQSQDDAYIYVDLTNSFTDARECFRYIIDVAIETHPGKFSYLKPLIESDRIKSNLLNHAEHTAELRKLLLAIKGKLVIILDEIDALTNTKFSDTIFKQIRSVYFSRVNFPEMERLTYVLSGVAEPSALIKDPSISPFNIGQSIFLGDFSNDEYKSFIYSSGLQLSNEIIERIYYWANGNPRITYDICSHVEGLLSEGKVIVRNDIDELVSSLYFTSIDRVPIDHIKELIKNDSELRVAVINIKTNSLSNISSQTRKKLYLSGIVGSDFDSNNLQIKNLIINDALSLEWLESLSNNIIDYKTVIALFKAERYLDITTISDENIESIINSVNGIYAENAIVISYFRLHLFQFVIDHFKKFGLNVDDTNESDHNKVKLENIYLCSLAYLSVGDFKNSIKCFELVISHKRKDEFYYRSLIECSNAFIGLKLYDIALDKLKSAVTSLSNEKHSMKSLSFQGLRNVAYYNMARCEIVKEDYKAAKKSLEASLRSADVASRPTLLYMLASIISDEDTRSELLEEAIQIIIENQFRAQDFGIQNILNVSYECIEGIANLCIKYALPDLFNAIAEYITAADLNERIEPIFFKNGTFIQNNFDDIELCSQSNLYSLILDNYRNSISKDQCNILLQFAVDINNNLNSFRDNLSLITALSKSEHIFRLEKKEAIAFADCLIYATANSHLIEAQILVNFMRRVYNESSSIHSRANKLLIDYCDMQVYHKSRNPLTAYSRSKEVIMGLALVSNSPEEDNSFLNAKSIEAIKGNTLDKFPLWHSIFGEIKTRNKRTDTVTAIYKSGEIKTGIFRIFEADLDKGKCVLL